MAMTTSAGWQMARHTVLSAGQVSRRQFFFTEQLPDGARNVHRVYAPVEKLGVVLSAPAWKKPIRVASFCGSVVQLDDGRCRLYYTTILLGEKEHWIAVAESEDGLSWTQPSLNQCRADGPNANRLVFEGLDEPCKQLGQPQVLRLRDGSWRMYFWRHLPAGYRYLVAHSEDGLRWRVDQPPRFVMVDHFACGRGSQIDGWVPGSEGQPMSEAKLAEYWRFKALRTNDACYVYYNERLDRFEYYAQWLVPAVPDRQVAVDNVPSQHRYIQRRLSVDGLTWSPPELIIMPDSRDSWDLQFYHLAVQWHEDWMIGSLGHYRVEGAQQTQDLELVFSRDGRQWHRPLRGGFIPRGAVRGAETEPDAKGIYPPNAWIDRGDHWLCLYTGTARRHNEASAVDPTRLDGIMAARWSKNRFLGLAAGRVSGGFLSEPFFPQDDQITVDADIRGWLRAELCDVFGRKHEGYHLMDSLPLSGDHTAHVLRWHGKDTAGFRHDAVRLRLEFADAEVYSLGF